MNTTTKNFNFEQSDFSHLNDAVKREEDYSNEALKNIRHYQYQSWSKIFLFVCSGLSVLMLTIGIIYWLFSEHITASDNMVQSSTQLRTEQDKQKEQKVLETLQQIEQERTGDIELTEQLIQKISSIEKRLGYKNKSISPELKRQVIELKSRIDTNHPLENMTYHALEEIMIQTDDLKELAKQHLTREQGLEEVTEDLEDISDILKKADPKHHQQTTAIKTSFTIFSVLTLASGETVTTGRVFHPDNLKIPVKQYCYLQHIGEINEISGIHIAHYKENELIYLTEDDELKKIAGMNCQFE
jgi:hypothetical protein